MRGQAAESLASVLGWKALLPDDFSIENAREWEERVMTPLLAQVTARLGCEQWAPVQADLYKLLLYEEVSENGTE